MSHPYHTPGSVSQKPRACAGLVSRPVEHRRFSALRGEHVLIRLAKIELIERLTDLAASAGTGHGDDQWQLAQALQGCRLDDEGSVNTLTESSGMDLDDVRRTVAEAHELVTQSLAGRTVAPQHISAVSPKHRAREVQ